MNSRLPLLGLILGLSILGHKTTAQFYAPQTDYHDAVQRVFVVEAARVLAARENAAGATNRFREVRWSLANSTNSTQWQLEWLDDKGATARTARVSYESNALLQGADFYRNIFNQLWKLGWQLPPSTKSDAVMAKFWSGAAQAAPSREQSLTTALALAASAAQPL